MLKSISFTSLLFFCTLALNAQNYSGDSWATVKAKGSGTLACVYYPTPGLVSEVDGKVVGVCPDIIDDFVSFVKTKYGKTVNIKYVGKETVWTSFLNNTLKGTNTLGVANVTITEERKKTMKFTPSFIQNPLIFLTNSAAPTMTSANQISNKLTGYKALVIKGSTHVKVMKIMQAKYFPSIKIEYASSGVEILKMIEKNPKTFTILDFTEYFDAIRNKRPIKRQNIEIEAQQENLGFIMPLSSDWYSLWEEFLTPAYKQSTGYKKIIANNLGNAFLGMLK